MFKDYWKYDWVLPVYRYEGLEPLLATLAEKVIAPAEAKVKALQERRRMIEAELVEWIGTDEENRYSMANILTVPSDCLRHFPSERLQDGPNFRLCRPR